MLLAVNQIISFTQFVLNKNIEERQDICVGNISQFYWLHVLRTFLHLAGAKQLTKTKNFSLYILINI